MSRRPQLIKKERERDKVSEEQWSYDGDMKYYEDAQSHYVEPRGH